MITFPRLPAELGAKINGILLMFFLAALSLILATLYVGRLLEGGAAAINEAGAERMRTYRIAYLLDQSIHDMERREALVTEAHSVLLSFESALSLLEEGDAERPLFLPREARVHAEMRKLRGQWEHRLRPLILSVMETRSLNERRQLIHQLDEAVREFVPMINEIVLMIEKSNARSTDLMWIFQNALVGFALAGTLFLVYVFKFLVIRPVENLKRGMDRMAAADFEVRLPVESSDEFGDLARGFNRMADRLKGFYDTLEQRVADKTRDIEEKNRELAVQERDIAVCAERNLLAQELHDSIAQSLAFLNIQAQMLQSSLRVGEIETAREELARIREGIQESYDNVRELLVHFRIKADHADFAEAVRSALEKFEGQTGIQTTFEKQGEAILAGVTAAHTLQILHILQEALSNVRKHANASAVAVSLQGDGEGLTVTLRDNGRGFDPSRVVEEGGSHVGISIMRERAHRIGARFELNSVKTGTGITLILPASPS